MKTPLDLNKINSNNITVKQFEIYLKAYKQYFKDHAMKDDSKICTVSGIIEWVNHGAPDYYKDAVKFNL